MITGSLLKQYEHPQILNCPIISELLGITCTKKMGTALLLHTGYTPYHFNGTTYSYMES